MKKLLVGLLAALSLGMAQKTLVFGSNGEPVSLEPGNITDGISIYVQRQIYDTLVDFKPGTTEPVPGLAESWESNKEATVWTFRLRRGVRFHDGTELTAEAVKFNVERWWDPKNPTRIDAAARYEIWPYLFGGSKGEEGSILKEIQVVDKYTIRFVLSKPFPAFPAAIGSGYFGIASPTAIQKDGAKYGSPTGSAVGTGPFRLVEWRPGDQIVLERNPNFWKPSLPKVDRLVFKVIKDPAARLAALKAGTIDFTTDIPPSNLRDLEADPNLDAVFRPSFNVGYYPNGFDLELWYMPVSRPYFPTPKEIAEALAADLSAIGIRVKLQTKDWASYLADRKKSPGFQAYMLGWTGDYGDPQNFYDPHFLGPIADLFDPQGKNLVIPELNELLVKGATTPGKEREAIYQRVDELTFDLALRVPIVHSQPLLAKRKNVTGWTPSPLGSESFEAVDKR